VLASSFTTSHLLPVFTVHGLGSLPIIIFFLCSSIVVIVRAVLFVRRNVDFALFLGGYTQQSHIAIEQPYRHGQLSHLDVLFDAYSCSSYEPTVFFIFLPLPGALFFNRTSGYVFYAVHIRLQQEQLRLIPFHPKAESSTSAPLIIFYAFVLACIDIRSKQDYSNSHGLSECSGADVPSRNYAPRQPASFFC
jgi:hypothetical protein